MIRCQISKGGEECRCAAVHQARKPWIAFKLNTLPTRSNGVVTPQATRSDGTLRPSPSGFLGIQAPAPDESLRLCSRTATGRSSRRHTMALRHLGDLGMFTLETAQDPRRFHHLGRHTMTSRKIPVASWASQPSYEAEEFPSGSRLAFPTTRSRAKGDRRCSHFRESSRASCGALEGDGRREVFSLRSLKILSRILRRAR